MFSCKFAAYFQDTFSWEQLWWDSSVTWSKHCVISSATGETEFATTVTKLYVPVVTLSTEVNIKLLKQFESGFKKTINWNKCQSKLAD